jgi:hypothetical protein
VITGYAAGSGELYVQDPLHGPSLQAFERFPAQYRSTGLWRGTFWTRKD